MKLKLLSAALFLGLMMAGCGGKTPKQQEKKSEPVETTKSSEKDMEQQTPMTDVTVKIETTKGDIVIKLYDETPLHRDNFVKLVKNKFYDGVIFHRVIKDFMIQTGDPESKNPTPDGRYGTGGPGYTIPAEFNGKFIHKKGALAAARQGDQVNPRKESSGSQFYIVQGKKASDTELAQIEAHIKATANPEFAYTAEQKEAYKTVGGTPFLDQGYTVFGEVIEGMDIIDAIAGSQTKPGDRPVQDIVIKKVTIVE